MIDLPEFYQVVNLMDHHRETWLEVEEHVSYEVRTLIITYNPCWEKCFGVDN